MVAALLNQSEVWVNAEGIHRLDDMDPDHRANLIPFLRGNARTLYGRTLADPDYGPALVSAAEAEEWMEQTPLMRRLVELEQGRPIEDRKRSADRNRRYEEKTGYQKVRHG